MRAGVGAVLSLAVAAVACGGAGDASPAGVSDPDGSADQPATCEHSVCQGGAALAGGCSSCADRICAADPACCSESWSQACVLAAASCDQVCPATGEPLVHPDLRDAALQHAPDPSAASHTVTPVVFVPADLADGPLVAAAGQLFAELAREGQGLYWHVTGGRTFALAPLETVVGDHESADYGDSEVRAEVTSALDRPHDGTRITWILWIGGSGRGGAYTETEWNPPISWTAMVGETSLYTHVAHVTGDPAWCGQIVDPAEQANCAEPTWIITAGMGAIVHELGHTFGLGHEDDHGGEPPADSFMAHHWNYFNIRSPETSGGALSEAYKDRLRASPYFAPR